MQRDLSAYHPPDTYRIEKSFIVNCIWYVVNNLIINSCFPGTYFRVMLMRLFGAKIGENVVIKPYVRVKFPWKLVIGQGSWIGESTWIDNHTTVNIADNACLSQGVYLCCGSHDWNDPHFSLIVGPIYIDSGAWICAYAKLGPNTRIGANAVVALGETFSGNLQACSIWKDMSVKSLSGS